MDDRLVSVYAEISEITSRACGARNGCLGNGERGLCCELIHCEAARILASHDGIDLGEPPYNKSGPCSVPPHLRPVCSVHQCEIASIGVFRKLSADDQRRYWELREEADLIEFETHE